MADRLLRIKIEGCGPGLPHELSPRIIQCSGIDDA